MSTINYTVTVASAKFLIDGAVAPKLTFRDGDTYVLDQADSSNAGHILQFSITSNNSGSAEYTTGVTKAGTPGNANAKTTIVTSGSTTDTLYYYSSGGGTYGAEFSNSGYNTSTDGLLKPIVGAEATAEKWGPMINHNIDQIVPKSGGTFSGNVVMSGNLTVNGTEVIVNTQTVEVEDNILQLNTTQASPDTATATTSGISVYRGDGVTQASLIFNDVGDKWDLTNDLVVAGEITGTLATVAQGNITSVGTLTALTVAAAIGEIRVEGTSNSQSTTEAGIVLEASSDRRAGILIEGDLNADEVFIGRPYDAANTLVFETNEVERMRITSAGNIETSTTGKIIQRGEAFMKTLHNSWVMGG